MSASTTLLLVRHGRTAWNEEARFQGQADPSLDAVGRAQSEQVARRLAAAGADALYVSDLQRAHGSAEIIGRRLGLEVHASAALRELSYGAWQGLTRQEIEARFPESWRQWLAQPEAHRPEEGEAMDEMTARVVRRLERLLAQHRSGRVVVVSHGGPIKSAVMHLLDIPASHRRRFVIHNASLSIFSLGAERTTLEALNDTCHLGAAESE
jgi:alpha-ribazole phosphatase/probable phosphoglycerate mutase